MGGTIFDIIAVEFYFLTVSCLNRHYDLKTAIISLQSRQFFSTVYLKAKKALVLLLSESELFSSGDE